MPRPVRKPQVEQQAQYPAGPPGAVAGWVAGAAPPLSIAMPSSLSMTVNVLLPGCDGRSSRCEEPGMALSSFAQSQIADVDSEECVGSGGKRALHLLTGSSLARGNHANAPLPVTRGPAMLTSSGVAQSGSFGPPSLASTSVIGLVELL